MKKFRVGLLPRVLIAILLGVILGDLSPEWCIRIFVTFNGLFSEFLGFIIPLVILGLVAPAIADIGSKAGRMLLLTVVLAYVSSVMAGFAAYFTGNAFFPMLIDSQAKLGAAGVADTIPFFSISIPPLMDVMTALVFAFVLGLGMAYMKGDTLYRMAGEFRDIIVKTIEKVIIPLLPLYIFGIFMSMTYSGEAFRVINVFIKIIGIIFALHVLWLIFVYSIAGIMSRRNPFRMLVKMLPAYFTALGTQSSAATIPVTLAQTRMIGVRHEVADFTVPLCATIHLSGSMLKIVSCALALMIMQQMPYDFGLFAGFIFMLAITAIAAPGVPGGAIMAALGILASMLGFTPEDQALIISIYIATDSFGTACNVTGDGALSVIVDRIMRSKDYINEKQGI